MNDAPSDRSVVRISLSEWLVENDLMSIRFVLVCYGDNLGYHHGAKYQILRGYSDGFYTSDSAISVVTDRPDLFEGYPIDLRTISQDEIRDWSFAGQCHFGIKNRALASVIKEKPESKFILLDTDMYWKRNPAKLSNKMSERCVILYRDEGKIFGSRNRSIQQFETGLRDQVIAYSKGTYCLQEVSHMWGSAIIGLEKSGGHIFDIAYELIEKIYPLVDAHTVEQFALSESLRIAGMSASPVRQFASDWSSIGRKNYATDVLANFFAHFGETDFETHLTAVKRVRIRRPFLVLLNQKYRRWRKS